MKMTSRQRVQRVLAGGRPDRVPFNFWMDRDIMAEYDDRWGADFRLTHYGVDVIESFALLPWWKAVESRGKWIQDGKTWWQVQAMTQKIEEALDCAMPSADDSGLVKDTREKRAANPDKAIFALFIAPLDILQPLRGAEALCTDIYDSPDVLHAILRRMQPVLVEAARRICAEDIDVLYLAGDLCSRNGPIYAPVHLREFQFDYLRPVIEVAHAAGKKVFYHSDGFLFPILDLYMEYGIDGINPLEPRFHDSEVFVRRTQGRLILYGGLDNTGTIPNGTPQQIRDFVRRQFQTLGADGRLIFSSHDIPSNCTLENLDAMVEAIKACRY